MWIDGWFAFVNCLGNGGKTDRTPRVTIAFNGPRGGTHGIHDITLESARALRDELTKALQEYPKNLADKAMGIRTDP